jgi:hypothetical protein
MAQRALRDARQLGFQVSELRWQEAAQSESIYEPADAKSLVKTQRQGGCFHPPWVRDKPLKENLLPAYRMELFLDMAHRKR